MAGGRPGKRQRVSDATQQQQQAHGSGPTMHLRSAQKRLLAAQAAARADSAVGSSQQLDRTDSCGPSQGASADAAAAPATAPRKGGLHSRKKPRTVRSEQQQQSPSDIYNDALQFADVFPSRAARAGIPSPLPSYELRRNFDRPSPPLRDADENGHYQFAIGENLAPRFKIMRKFGEGTFGQVLECWDRKRKDYVAVKIIRNIEKYRDAAMIELEALNTLQANDPCQTRHCVQLLEWFNYRGHVCMVFERLGPSLYDILRRNGYKPFPFYMAQAFAKQLLESVAYMHETGLVHTDLKPENILVTSQDLVKEPGSGSSSKVAKRLPPSTTIRVIDFGSATFERDYHSTVVCTRHYRAPEVILGLGWSYPCDIWSMGCIIIELLTGDALFQTHENMEHLAMMEVVLGPIPTSLVVAATGSVRSLFKRNNQLNWPAGAENKKSIKAVQKLKKLKEFLKKHCEAAVRSHLDTVVDLLHQMLDYRAAHRITATRALQHPFFQLHV